MLQILICFMAMSYMNLMPIFAENVLNGNAETMGFLMTASALGSLVANFYLILRKQAIGLEKIMAYSTALLGLSLILFSRSTNLQICLVLIFMVAMNNSLTLTAISNFIQLILVDQERGAPCRSAEYGVLSPHPTREGANECATRENKEIFVPKKSVR